MSRAAIDKFPGGGPRHRRQGQCRHAGSAIDDLSADLYWRSPLADRACAGDRSRRHRPVRQAWHHRLDAAATRPATAKWPKSRLGPTRLAGPMPGNRSQASGAKLAFGSDVPVELSDPWAGWAAAISRVRARWSSRSAAGSRRNGSAANKRFAAYTANGAYAGFAEGRFGRLVPGPERADFLLVDRDPLLGDTCRTGAPPKC
jgi:hypothetical protein